MKSISLEEAELAPDCVVRVLALLPLEFVLALVLDVVVVEGEPEPVGGDGELAPGTRELFGLPFPLPVCATLGAPGGGCGGEQRFVLPELAVEAAEEVDGPDAEGPALAADVSAAGVLPPAAADADGADALVVRRIALLVAVASAAMALAAWSPRCMGEMLGVGVEAPVCALEVDADAEADEDDAGVWEAVVGVVLVVDPAAPPAAATCTSTC